MQRAADDRADAVGADQQVAFATPPSAICSVTRAPVTVNPVTSLLERDRVHANRFEQGAVQRRPQRHDHRAAECLGWQLGALQDGAVHPAQLAASRLEAASQHRVRNAERSQGRDRVRRKAESEAELARRRRPFEDADRPSCLPQRDTGRQAADAGADDQGGAGQ